jgi:Phosphotransferase enzyme family
MRGEDGQASDKQLGGGLANAGAVVLRDGVVHRPATECSDRIHDFLRLIRERGFDGVPRPLSVARGEERLQYIVGKVPLPPFPEWWTADRVLASTAALLRRFHDASDGVDFGDRSRWSTELADPSGGEVICHNDVCPENVVYRDGQAVALLDFDYAAPGRRVYDLAQLAKMCCPLDHPANAAFVGLGELDPVARLRLIADAYGLGPDRRGFLDAINDAIQVGEAFVRRHVEQGDPAFVAMWGKRGGEQRAQRRSRWFLDNHARLLDALSCAQAASQPSQDLRGAR